MENVRELKAEEMEKVSGGSIHFPHIAPTSYWRCDQCGKNIPFYHDTSEEEKQRKISEHKAACPGA